MERGRSTETIPVFDSRDGCQKVQVKVLQSDVYLKE